MAALTIAFEIFKEVSKVLNAESVGKLDVLAKQQKLLFFVKEVVYGEYILTH